MQRGTNALKGPRSLAVLNTLKEKGELVVFKEDGSPIHYYSERYYTIHNEVRPSLKSYRFDLI